MGVFRIRETVKYALLSIILALSCVVVASILSEDESSGATSGTCGDNLSWEYNTDTGHLTISGYGAMKNYFNSDLRWGGNVIKSVSFPENMTSVGSYAFKGSTQLTTVSLPSTVTSIGMRSFNGCTGLTSINMSDSVETIGEEAFSGCSSLASITIPSSVSSIGRQAFVGCSSLVTLYYNTSQITSLYEFPYARSNMVFNGCGTNTGGVDVVFAEGVTRVPAYFADPKDGTAMKIKTITFPSTLNTIGLRAFYGSSFISGPLVIPNNVSFGEYAFTGCTKLLEISVGSGCTVNSNSFSSHTFYKPDGTTVVSPSGPGFSGYTFIGTSRDRMIRQIVYHQVTYETDGGSLPAPTQSDVAEEASFTVASYSGTKSGFDFGGWSYNSTTYQPDSSIVVGTSDIILTAVWVPKYHKVTYNTNGGTASAPVQADVQEGTNFTVKSYSGSKIGFSFGGWSYNSSTYDAGESITMGTSDITLIAVWVDLPTHTITYDVNGGSAAAPTHSPVKEQISFTAANYSGTKTGYNFSGWSYGGNTYLPGSSITMGTSDIVLIAVWTEKDYHTVTYDVNGGSDPAPVQGNVREDSAFTVKSYGGSKTGFSFGGWSYNSTTYNAGSSIVMGTSDITLVAVWIDLPTHAITYNVNGGSISAPTQSPVKEQISFTVASYSGTKSGYSFGGWSYMGDTYQPGSSITMGTSDIALIAVWTEKDYHKVTYVINGGSDQAPVQGDVREDSSFTVKSYSGTKAGYSFEGWQYNSSTYDAGSSIIMGTSDIVLSAVWVLNGAHRVIYDTNGGTGAPPEQDDVPEGLSFTVKEFSGSRPGHTFGGWTYNETTYQPGSSITMGTSNITLTAIWSANETHHVLYNVNGGSVMPPIQPDVAVGESFKVSMYTGTKSGYVFNGWSYNDAIYKPNDDLVMGTSDIEFLAIWKDNDIHTVWFDANGGSKEISPKDVREGESFVLQSYTGIRDGFEFNGWENEKGETYSSGTTMTMGTSDMTFKAVWKQADADASNNNYTTTVVIIVAVTLIIVVPAGLFALRALMDVTKQIEKLQIKPPGGGY